MFVVDARKLLDGLNARMPGRIDAGRGDLDLAWIFLEGLQKILERFVGRIGSHGHDLRQGNIQEQVPVADVRIDHPQDLIGAQILGRPGCPRIAIPRRIQGVLGPDRTRGARLVDHHHLLSQRAFQFTGAHPRNLVGGPPGPPRNDEFDRLLRFPGVGTYTCRYGQQQAHQDKSGNAVWSHDPSLVR